MARKYSSDSSDDDGDRKNRRSSRKDPELAVRSAREVSSDSSSDSDRKTKIDRNDDRRRAGKGRDEVRRRKEVKESSDEEGELVEREDGDSRGKEKRSSSERNGSKIVNEEGERRDRSDKDRSRNRRHDDDYRGRDRHSRRDADDERSKDRHRHRDRDYDDRDRRHRTRDDEDGGDRHRRDRDRDGRREESRNEKVKEDAKPEVAAPDVNSIPAAWSSGKSGGVYIPPFKLARMMKEVDDKSSVEYQRLTWDALRKSINGLVNKVNAANIKNIIPELFSENLIRGRGLFCRSCMKSQMASPGFTDVFAALAAVVNTKFPEVGELLLKRIVLQLKRAYKRNDKPQLLAAVKFVAHLVNQQVAHEIIALELLAVLLANPTDDSVEVAVGFVIDSGSMLQDLSPKGLHGAFERFRAILHEGEIDKRVQFLIEGLFAIRKAKFQGYPAVRPELDLNEKRYEDLKKNILGEDSDVEEGSDAGSDDDDEDDDDEDDEEEENEEMMRIQDETETNLVNLRRTIYLTIMSSVDFEEAGHKLLRIRLEPGQEMELCIMLLECCSQERTYLRYYGLLGQRFCMINRIHQENFEKCFVQQYSMIHRLETNKLRNVAKFFAHLLGTDALPWHVLAYIRLTEEDTTSSSRIFIKILFQELSEHLGIRNLNDRLSDPAMQDSFESIFPRDNPKNTRFSINFFTSIGLGGITENLREYLKNMPRLIMQQQKPPSDSDSDSDKSSDSDSSDSSSESESESSSSEEDRRSKRKKRKGREDRDSKRSKMAYQNEEAELEVRPGGMLVQKRDGDDRERTHGGGSLNVINGARVQHEVQIPAHSTLGELKRVIEQDTGSECARHKMLFRGKARDDAEHVHNATKEREEASTKLDVKQIAKILKAMQAIDEVRTDVDKLSERVHALKVAVNGGTKIADQEFIVTAELLMRQLLRLDMIDAIGEARIQRRTEVHRIQKLHDSLDDLKARNAKLADTGIVVPTVTTNWEKFDSGMGSLTPPAPVISSAGISQNWESFD
ncbi:Pre-mRNA-splicing factor CWC22 homolog [Linum grandiflorum]